MLEYVTKYLCASHPTLYLHLICVLVPNWCGKSGDLIRNMNLSDAPAVEAVALSLAISYIIEQNTSTFFYIK